MNKLFTRFLTVMTACFFATPRIQAQVQITTNDTSICPGTTVTLNAIVNGRTPTVVPVTGALDDKYSNSVNIGFPFTFYGNSYSTCFVSTNGYIRFGSGLAGNFSDWDITSAVPGLTAVKNSIMGYYADIEPTASTKPDYATIGTAPNRQFVVTFCNVPMFDCSSNHTTFQMVLFEGSNNIDVHIGNAPGCNVWPTSTPGVAIEGVQNSTATLATTVPGRNYPTVWTASQSSHEFVYDPISGNYTVSPIPYAPVPNASATITWYANGVAVGTGSSINVSPTVNTSYIATVVDCGITSSDTVTVSIGGSLQIDSLVKTDPTTCNGNNGTINIYTLTPNVTYNVSYTLNGTATTTPITTDAAGVATIPGLSAGTYGTIFASIGSCVSNTVGPITLMDPPTPNIDSVVATPTTTCGGTDGTVTIYGLSAGLTYTINYKINGVSQLAQSLTASPTGTIVLTGGAGTYNNITAQRTGCLSNVAGPAIIMDPPLPTIDSVTVTGTSTCFATDGTVTIHGLMADSSYTVQYIFNGGATTVLTQTATPNGTITFTGGAGTYNNITVSIHNCISAIAGPVTIADPAPPVISATSSTNTSTCFANDGTVTLFGLIPGATYVVNYTLNSAPQPPLTLTAGTAGSITFNGPAGSYAGITVTLGACVSNIVGPVLVSDPPPIVITGVASTDPTVCGASNGTITLTGLNPSQGYTLNYTDGTGTVHVASIITDGGGNAVFSVPAGTYTNIVMKQGNCVSNAEGPITLNDPAFSAAYVYKINWGCGSDTVSFTNTSVTSGPMSYIWQFNDGTTDTITDPVHAYTTQALYAVKLIATNGVCIDSTTQQIDLNHPLDAAFTVSKDTICQNSSVTFANSSVTTTKNGINPHFTWYFGDGSSDTSINPSHTYTQQGVYTVTLVAQDFVPCVDSAFATITVDSIPFVSFTMSDTDICVGQSVTLVGNYLNIGNTGYNWDFGDGITATNPNPITHAYAVAGSYDISLTASYRVCPDTTFKKKLQVRTFPGINLGPDTAICPNGAAIVLHDVVSAAIPGATYLWSTGATTYAISTHDTGLYWATVSVNGCTATDSVEIYRDCYVEIPNSFTPNGDGLNDYFFPRQMLSSSVTAFSMKVFDRWGELIFTTTNIDGRGWDGKINDVAQPTGVYVYVIDVAYANGVAEHYQGNVTLLR